MRAGRRVIFRPPWHRAPLWARWFAIDYCGNACWFEYRPVQQGKLWRSIGRIDRVARLPKKWDPPWIISLESRPEQLFEIRYDQVEVE